VQAFPDLAEGVAACPPGCNHLSPDCGLDEWVAEHDDGSGALAARLDSLRRLLRSREADDDN
jgi:ribosome biogenesis GTPase / thiamine phosphate phosphatase